MGRRPRNGVVGALAYLATIASARGEEDADCSARLAARTADYEQLKTEFVDRVYPRTVFAKTKPNPTAERALGPLVERAMEKLSPEPPAVALECHTWACRIRVLHGTRIDPARWERALASGDLQGRLHSVAVVGRRPTTDALDGEDLVEATVYFKLVDPSGEPVASRPRRLVAVPPKCAAALAEVEKRIESMKLSIDRDVSPAERFAREPDNPPLTAHVESRLRQATTGLMGTVARLSVSCHGVICQVQPPVGAALTGDQWRQLESRPPLSELIVGRAYHLTAAYWAVRPRETADGKTIVDRLIADIETGPLLETCHKQQPSSGHLLVTYVLAGRDPLGRAAKKGGLSVVCTGSLAETPLGRCVCEGVERAMAVTTLPAEVLNRTRSRRYDWVAGSDRPTLRAR